MHYFFKKFPENDKAIWGIQVPLHALWLDEWGVTFQWKLFTYLEDMDGASRNMEEHVMQLFTCLRDHRLVIKAAEKRMFGTSSAI